MLGGLALKRRWQQRRRAEGKPADRPNMVIGTNVQVCWEKFANYWDVEMRQVPMEGDRFHMSAEGAVALCDENTIGVVAVLGLDVRRVVRAGRRRSARRSTTCRRAPAWTSRCTSTAPPAGSSRRSSTRTWCGTSRLPRVASINASGHKYGLVYPGVGWVVWRDAEALPADLIFWVNYLGDNMPTFALNFSRPGAQVVAQYYNFLRLGFDGLRGRAGLRARGGDPAGRRDRRDRAVPAAHARGRAAGLRLHARRRTSRATRSSTCRTRCASRAGRSRRTRSPPNRTDLAALRVVVRRGFSHDLADLLLDDLRRVVPRLQARLERRAAGRRRRPGSGDVGASRH